MSAGHPWGCVLFARAHVGGAPRRREELSAGKGLRRPPHLPVCLQKPALGLAGPWGSRSPE